MPAALPPPVAAPTLASLTFSAMRTAVALVSSSPSALRGGQGVVAYQGRALRMPRVVRL